MNELSNHDTQWQADTVKMLLLGSTIRFRIMLTTVRSVPPWKTCASLPKMD